MAIRPKCVYGDGIKDGIAKGSRQHHQHKSCRLRHTSPHRIKSVGINRQTLKFYLERLDFALQSNAYPSELMSRSNNGECPAERCGDLGWIRRLWKWMRFISLWLQRTGAGYGMWLIDTEKEFDTACFTAINNASWRHLGCLPAQNVECAVNHR